MRLLRAARIPVLIAWLVIIGVVGSLVSQPRLLAPYAASLVSRHLLRIEGGGLRVRDFHLRGVEGLDLYGVSLTLPRENGGMTLVSADTVRLDFSLREVLGSPPRLRRLAVSRPELYARAGRDTTVQPESASEGLGLPDLFIDRLEVDDAHLEFSDGHGRLVELVRDLDLRGAFASRGRLQVNLESCTADWESRQTRLKDLTGEMIVDDTGFHTAGLTGGVNEGTVRIAGLKGWGDELDLTVSARRISVAEIENVLDMTLGFEAAGDVDGSIRAVGDSVVFSGGFNGEIEGYEARGLSCRVVVGPGAVLLTGVDGRFNEARFRGGGRIDLGPPVVLILEGDVQNVGLHRGLVPDSDDLPESDGWGHIHIRHQDTPRETRVRGTLRDGHIAIAPFDSCRFQVTADPDSVRFQGFDLWYRDLHAWLEGAADTSGFFVGDLEVESSDLSSLPGQWNWPALQGGMAGAGRLHGPLEDLSFRGWVDVDDLVLDPVSAERVETAVVIEDALGDPRVRAGMEGQGLAIRGVALGDFDLWGAASSRGARVDTFRSVLGDTAVSLRFEADFSDSVHTFRVREFAVGLEGTDWTLAEPMVMSVGQDIFSLPETSIGSDRGSVVVSGYYRRDEVLTGHLALDRFNLALLGPFITTEEPLAGTLSADLVVGGLPDAPVVDATALLTDAPFALARVDTLTITAGFGQGALDIRDMRLATPFGRVEVRGEVAHPGAGLREFWSGANLDLEVGIRQGDWAFLDQFALPALDRLAGTFDGDLTVAGTTDSPLIRGGLHSAPFHIHWLHLDELTGEIWADEESMVLGNLEGRKDALTMTGHLEIPSEMDFLSTPVTPEDGPFYLQLEIPADTDLEPLSRATNAFIRSEGRGEASVVISGPLSHPLFQGRLDLREVGFVLRNMEEVYHDISVTGAFRGDELVLRDIVGREGLKGTIKGDGRVIFDGLELRTFDLRLDLDRFLIASLPDLRVLVRGQGARLTGVKVGPDSLLVPKFSGSLEVIKARYTGNFSEGGGSSDPMAATVAPDWLAELRLHGEPRTSQIINRDMDLSLGGDLDLMRNQTGLFLRGAMDVKAGQLVVFNNSFKVVRGRLDFSQEIGFNPRVDLDAETRYRLRSQYSSDSVVEVIGVHVGGTLRQPEISFSSQRGYSATAIQRMLLGLSPYATSDGDVEALQDSGISAGLNVLEREFARELAIFDTLEIDQIRRQRDTGESGLDPLIGVGKYIGSDLYLKYAQGLSTEDQDIAVEYQINRHLLLQTEVRRRLDENQGQPTFNLDLKYRFEY